ncbi:MAG: hypothetical protein C5B47_01990 [Verrucomicrobia bacterium]|nr:MAG: hypothetical protein C5B47_01990 [Verrucomicrobiota bacterium]
MRRQAFKKQPKFEQTTLEDGLKKPVPKSLRQSGQCSSGGQKGHPGATLRQVEIPDVIITHRVPKVCEECQRELNPTLRKTIRQVFDLPEPEVRVTEHRAEEAGCLNSKVF